MNSVEFARAWRHMAIAARVLDQSFRATLDALEGWRLWDRGFNPTWAFPGWSPAWRPYDREVDL
jgi:hypothetical protein